MHSQVLQQPGIKLSLLAAGSSEVAYGRRSYHLGPQANVSRRNQAALVALAEPDTFSRYWRQGREESKISITLKPQWLEQAGFGMLTEHVRLARFANEHMAERPWLPSPQAMLAVQQVLQPPPLLPALQEIFIQSRCLDIIVEALSLIAHADAAAEQRALNPRAQRKLRQLQELLDSGAADEWSLQAIATHVGSNPTSLQQLFRRDRGYTIFEYQRQRRLQRARVALTEQGISVEEAAAIAGYSSAANFATAFKRMFGITPRAARG
jgi:AraC-like DNA-binding protein